jgi:UDP-N-acetylmuramoyl-tripeptide--D-alanyl-D-alanine ligase
VIRARLAQLAQPLHPRLIKGDAGFAGASTDSRTLLAGELFVALRGERFDGHDYAARAATNGAAALLVERELPVELPQIVVADSLHALGALARWYRAASGARVAGITGSNGKTTVKTLLAAILARCGTTHVNAGNLNNEIGLPLSVLCMADEARYAVFEMGAGKPGDIEYLAGIAQPHVGLVNNVAPAHLERMHSEQGVAETKGALYRALPADGVAVINADDRFAGYFAELAAGRTQLRFGLEQPAEIGARVLELGAGSRFLLRTPAGELDVALPLAGRHNVMNALAAAAAAHALGAPLATIRAGLEAAPGVAGRLTRRATPHGATVIDDSYNANPGSTRAAIDVLALHDPPRWLVLGNMAELGPEAERLHAEIGGYARAAGLERLVTVGALARAAAERFGAGAVAVEDREAAVALLRAELPGNATVLVKGSRSSAMEHVVRALTVCDGENQHAA